MCAKTRIDQIVAFLNPKGIKLLFTEFKGRNFKHPFSCNVGHFFETSWASLKKSKASGCPVCAGQVLDLKRLTQKAAEYKGELLTELKDYKNSNQKLSWECSEGHIFQANWKNVSSGKWCPYCSGNKPPTIFEMSSSVKAKNGILISTKYEKAKTKYEWQCEQGHKFETNWNNVKSGKWCPHCTNHVSKEQKEVQNFLQEFFSDIQHSFRIPGTKKEFDILVNKNLAIEYH